jgi:TPP-dependent trihydroxycyclohexane-1,2-dione (THcHDO) dehydratase
MNRFSRLTTGQEDVQAEAHDWPIEFFEKRIWHVRRPVPEPELVREVVKMLKAAKRPLIISGGGTIYSEASEELRHFVEEFGIPVTETQAGKGVLNWNHPMNAGPIGSNGATSANKLAREADLIIAIGTRLSDFTTASKSAFQNRSVRFVGINVAPMDANKLSARAIVADAKRALNALRGELKEAGYAGTQVGVPKRDQKFERGVGRESHRIADPAGRFGSARPDRVTVIVVPVDPEKRMPGMGTWWDVPVADVSGEERTRQTRETYEKATENQRPVFA